MGQIQKDYIEIVDFMGVMLGGYFVSNLAKGRL